MKNKHYLGTFQSNASPDFARGIYPICRGMTTSDTFAVAEYIGGGGIEEVQNATELMNYAILNGWRKVFENKD